MKQDKHRAKRRSRKTATVTQKITGFQCKIAVSAKPLAKTEYNIEKVHARSACFVYYYKKFTGAQKEIVSMNKSQKCPYF